MNIKTISICLLGIVMMLASLWIGSWAAHEFAGTWIRNPAIVSAVLAFYAGFRIVGAIVSASEFGDENG